MAYLHVSGMVLGVSPERDPILIKLSGLLDENDSAWIPRPPAMPAWCEQYLFYADLDASIETFDQLKERPDALTNFRPSKAGCLSKKQLSDKLESFVARHLDQRPTTKRSTEVLTHYSCPVCAQWWTIGDSPYKPGDKIHCPNGHLSMISDHDSCSDKLEPMA